MTPFFSFLSIEMFPILIDFGINMGVKYTTLLFSTLYLNYNVKKTNVDPQKLVYRWVTFCVFLVYGWVKVL